MTLEDIATVVQAGGVIFLLVVAIYGLYKKWWVPGWMYSELEKSRDEWKTMALDGLRTAADMAQAAKSHTSLTPAQAEEALRIVREAGKGHIG